MEKFKIKIGETYPTKGGDALVQIIRDDGFPDDDMVRRFIGFVTFKTGRTTMTYYNAEGVCWQPYLDFLTIVPPKRMIKGWINVYDAHYPIGGIVYDTREEAQRGSSYSVGQIYVEA
jgi:hypothetical protein